MDFDSVAHRKNMKGSEMKELRDSADEVTDMSLEDINLNVPGASISPIYGMSLDTESLGSLELFKQSYDVIICYVQCFSAMGLTLNLLGPILKLLEKQVHVNSTSQMALFFVARAVGFLCGTLLGGQVADRLGRYKTSIFMAFGIFMSAIITCLYPQARSLWQLMLIGLCSSLFMGFNDNVLQILLMALYKVKSGPFMQALHMGYGLGGFLAPVFIASFLKDGEEDTSVDDYQYAFYSMAVYIIACGTFLTILILKHRYPTDSILTETETTTSTTNAMDVQTPDTPETPAAPAVTAVTKIKNLNGFSGNGKILLLLTAFILFFFIAISCAFGNLLAAYAKDRKFMFDKEAAVLTSVYWVCFLVGRFIGIPISMKFSNRVIIYTDLIVSVASMVLLQLLVNSVPVLWISSGVLGMGTGSLYAATVVWLGFYIEMSGTVLSVIVTMVSLADALFPLFVAIIMDLEHVLFVTHSLISISICLILYIIADRYQRNNMNGQIEFVDEESTPTELQGTELKDI